MKNSKAFQKLIRELQEIEGPKSPARIRQLLQKLRQDILSSSVEELTKKAESIAVKGWRGADVIVTDDFNLVPSQKDDFRIWVRTRHARILGWMFIQFREIFRYWWYFGNKIGFYMSFGVAARDYLVEHPEETDDPRPLLLAVIAVAERWADCIEKFGCMPDNLPDA